ncbi:MAG: PrsW family glutamic-type intramembrane protease [Candidatus Thorarchaeota archaeon]
MWTSSFRRISERQKPEVDPLKAFIGISFIALILWMGILICLPFFRFLAPMAFYCGPFLFAPIWTAGALWLFRKNSQGFWEKDQLRVIALPLLIVACTVAFSALILNSNAMLLSIMLIAIVDSLGIEMSEKFLIVLIVGFVGPCVEEIIKLLPILALSQATIERSQLQPGASGPKRVPLLNSVRLPLLFGIVTGSAFVVLETYFYMFYVSVNVESNVFEYRYLQLFIRTVGPLHVLTAAISGLGIGLALQGSRQSGYSRILWHRALAAFLVAWGLHAAWNTIAVLTETSSEDTSFILQENALFVGMAIGVALLLLGLILIIGLREASVCPICGVQKASQDCFVCQKPLLLPTPRRFRLSWRKKKHIKCPRCKKELSGFEPCQACNAQLALICPSCWRMVGAAEKACQYCGENLQLLPEALPREHMTRLDAIARGSVGVFAAWMIPMALGVLTFAAYLGEDFDALFVLAVPFVLAGLAALLGLVLEETPHSRASGRYIVALVFYTMILSLGLFSLAALQLLVLVILQSGQGSPLSILLSLVSLVALTYALIWLFLQHLRGLHLVFPLEPSKAMKTRAKWSSSSGSKFSAENILIGLYAFAIATGLYMVIVQVWLIAEGEFSFLPVLFLSSLEIGFIIALFLLLFLGGSVVDPFISLLLLWVSWAFAGFVCGVRYGRSARFAMFLGTVGPYVASGIFFLALIAFYLILIDAIAVLFLLVYIVLFAIIYLAGFTLFFGLFLGFPAFIAERFGEQYFAEERPDVRFGRLYQARLMHPPFAPPPYRHPHPLERDPYAR